MVALKNRTRLKKYEYRRSAPPSKMADNKKSINHFTEDNFAIHVSFRFTVLSAGCFLLDTKKHLDTTCCKLKYQIIFWKSRRFLKSMQHNPTPPPSSLAQPLPQHFPYKPYETNFARIFLFLETGGLLDSFALYAVLKQ